MIVSGALVSLMGLKSWSGWICLMGWMGLMGWWCSGIVLSTHVHQVIAANIYFVLSNGTSLPHVDVDPPQYVVDLQSPFVAVPPFVLEGLGS